MEKPEPISIHPGMLNSYPDCGLRAAVGYWGPNNFGHVDQFKARGIDIPARPRSAAAAVGNGVHLFVKQALKSLRETGSGPNIAEATEVAAVRLSRKP